MESHFEVACLGRLGIFSIMRIRCNLYLRKQTSAKKTCGYLPAMVQVEYYLESLL